MLADKYPSQINAILAKYPTDQRRSAVMPLLYLAQGEYGYLSPEAMDEVGAIVGLARTEVAGLIGFYTLYYDHQEGRRRMQICTDLPCALRGAEAFAEEVCQRLGVRLGGTTADGQWTVEPVMCLAACDKAPMFQVQDAAGIHYHESASAEKPMTADEALQVLAGYAPPETGEAGQNGA